MATLHGVLSLLVPSDVIAAAQKSNAFVAGRQGVTHIDGKVDSMVVASQMVLFEDKISNLH